MKDISKLPFRDNSCSHCNGTGRTPYPNVGFKLSVGDTVEDHCGLRVRVDSVYALEPTLGWGTTLNAPDSWVVGPNHSHHRIDTDNDHYAETLWTKIS
jgi:hypothetical protein